MQNDLSVWAEHIEGFMRVGTLSIGDDGQESFLYDGEYLACDRPASIYPTLPLQSEAFDVHKTRAAFSSLGPEGPVGHDIRTALRAGRESITPVLARLNHETVGALTFTAGESEPCYGKELATPLEDVTLAAFSRNPLRVAFDEMMRSRLSINGAVAKIGAIKGSDGWYRPLGFVPSTHILKAGSEAFPHQMLNEALCMRCAAACGFDDAAETELIAIDGADPILASRRFDRVSIDSRPAGLPSVMRLHQADFCQVLGIETDALKYTPADELVEGYTSSVAIAITKESHERYGDRSFVFDKFVFDYLVGNCDNHLKNISLTWSADWGHKAVSPLYDVCCTTIYPGLSRDLGMGIGRHRAIDEVEPDDFPLMAEQLAVGWRQARVGVAEMADKIAGALMSCAHVIELEYGIGAMELAERLARDCASRVEVALKAAG